MKKGFIIGKRQITVVALIAAMGGAVWLNMHYASKQLDNINISDLSSKVLGQTQYVNGEIDQSNTQTNDYFTQTRAERAKSREEAIKLLQSTVDNVKTDDADRTAAQAQIARIAKDIETEAAIESLIKAKGFSDAVAVMSEEDISVVVKTEEKLLASETMQIMDIVTAKTDFASDKIKILTSK